MKTLTYPFSEKAIRSLKTGDAVSISGRVYTGRDKLHKFFADGGSLPVDFRDGALYHCGPVCVEKWRSGEVEKWRSGEVEKWKSGEVEKWKSGEVEKWRSGEVEKWGVVAAGPTTSVRESPYEPAFIAATGVRIVIGKGGMDAATLAAMKEHGCVYVQAVGGAGALYAAAVKKVAGVSMLDEFGAAEAVWHFDVEDFRGVVAMDAHGRSLFDDVGRASAKALSSLAAR